MGNQLISIIVPVYNVEKYLAKCVESLINQTYKNIEIILVDDGSTDASGKICDKLEMHYGKISVMHKKNGGLSSARNAGIAIARGSLIGFVDSDDYVDRNMYEKLANDIEKHNADIAICNQFLIFEDGRKILRFNVPKKDIVMNSSEAILELNCFRRFDMSACNKLYKSKLFEDVRFPEGRLSEDYFVMYRLFDLANKIVFCYKPLYFYLQRNSSISKTPKLNYDFVEAAEQQMNYVEKKYPLLKTVVHSAYASACMTIYNIMLKHGGKCTNEDITKLKKIVHDNWRYIKANKEWSHLKKIQSFLFIYSLPLYNRVYVLYRKIKTGK